jgi:hypothetical protein
MRRNALRFSSSSLLAAGLVGQFAIRIPDNGLAERFIRTLEQIVFGRKDDRVFIEATAQSRAPLLGTVQPNAGALSSMQIL